MKKESVTQGTSVEGTFEHPVIDSDLSLEEALMQNPGRPCPSEILERQRVVGVRYISAGDGLVHEGQVVVHHELVGDIEAAFEFLLAHKVPVGPARPAADPEFLWDDERLMAGNISSGFNYRPNSTRAEELSPHAEGRAVDINPLWNPYIDREGGVHPSGATYDPSRPGTFTEDHPFVVFMEERGWVWGGRFQKVKDYHHFEKEV